MGFTCEKPGTGSEGMWGLHVRNEGQEVRGCGLVGFTCEKPGTGSNGMWGMVHKPEG